MKTSKLLLSLIAVLALLTSCNDSYLDHLKQSRNDAPYSVIIQGELGQFAPATRSTAESCIRMRWTDGDVVYAYGSDGSGIVCLGRLTVTVEDAAGYVAAMKGLLTAVPADADGTLYLVHSPLLTSVPELSEGTLAIDMQTQSADVMPFVAYATVTGVTAESIYAETALKTTFTFATSVLRIHATGISGGASLTAASLSDIETVCKLTIDSSTGTFLIAGDETRGTLTKQFSEADSLTDTEICIGVPAFTAAADGRVLTVTAGGEDYYNYHALPEACTENRCLSYVYGVKTLKYVDEYGEDRGNGIYIAATGRVWAPVNCGYEPKNYKYGKLYQWGRREGGGYKDTHDTNSDAGDVIQTKRKVYTPIAASDEVSSVFYNVLSPHNDWLTPQDDTRWDATGGSEESHTPVKAVMDPCPPGWRVPTCAEMTALMGGRWSGELQTGNHGVLENVAGKYFNGSDENIQTTGVFLPAAGGRNNGGGPNERAVAGHYWTSSVVEDEAYHLTFTNTLTYITSYYRPQAYSVRCVQE